VIIDVGVRVRVEEGVPLSELDVLVFLRSIILKHVEAALLSLNEGVVTMQVADGLGLLDSLTLRGSSGIGTIILLEVVVGVVVLDGPQLPDV
jgi:hypothetical protein